ncbi:hypothetical protein DSO57_1038244 [Entomophthora muscae]|uniref:Uncharacterized protein n=1 Tax=Entomophthora muscae TaxID=34485 RepID=A0ACC2RDT9_9FUNG|nr:hypothetical protein DSO57_1038244 [Entomophthora muscae]
MTTPSSRSLAMTHDTLWRLVDRDPTVHSQFATRVRVHKPKFNKIMVHLKTQQAISACLFKTGMKTKGDPPKMTKAVKKYTEISKVVLAYYPKDSKLEHL